MNYNLDDAPWNMQEGESSEAFQAFKVYRDLGVKRSLVKVSDKLYGKVKNQGVTCIKKWSTRFEWVKRVRAWEDYLDTMALQARVKAVQKMNAEHISVSKKIKSLALERLDNMNPLELEPKDVLKFLVEAVKIERQARGEPDAILEAKMSEKYNSGDFDDALVFESPEQEEKARLASQDFVRKLGQIAIDGDYTVKEEE